MPYPYNGLTGHNMRSLVLYTVEEIFGMMDDATQKGRNRIITPDGRTLRTTSVRLQLFKTKGVICHSCKLEASLFSLERVSTQPGSKPHLNLYALVEDKFILFTKDHIIPKSKGGPESLENFVTMCSPCNGKKENILPPRTVVEGVVAELQNNGHVFNVPLTLEWATNDNAEPDILHIPANN